MQFKSKFTERFDIDPSIASTSPPSPTKLSIVCSLSSTAESDPNLNSRNASDPNISTTSIDTQLNPQKRTSLPTSLVSPPFQQNDKRHDALASKFKHFLNTIKRKERTSTVATPLPRAVSTKY